MQEAISNITRAIPELDEELYFFLGGTHIQIGTKEVEGFTPVYRTEVQRLSRMIEEIEADVESFKALLPRTVKVTKRYRKKRGLVNMVGYAFKYLFGTMDNRDMETINHFIDEMQVFSENVVHGPAGIIC